MPRTIPEVKKLSGEVIEMGIVTEITVQEATAEKNTEVARLYRRANSQVKKALSFTTKRDAAKMA